MRSRATVLLAPFLAAPLASAALLTVGPSGQFAEIKDALAAAQPGDVILVQPGTYEEIAVDLPVRILGDGSGDVIVSSPGSHGIVVTGIPAGEEAVLSGIEVRSNPLVAPAQGSVHLASNAGTVVLQGLRVSFQSSFSQVAVAAQDCARVLLLDAQILEAGASGFGASAAVTATGSELWIANSTITGKAGVLPFSEPGEDGVSLVNGSLHVWRSTIRGGSGASGKATIFAPDGGDGIDAASSSVTLYGGPAGEVRGGDGAFGWPFGGGHGAGGAGLRLAAGSTARIQQALPISGGIDGSGLIQTPAVAADGTSSSALEPFLFPTLAASAEQTAVGGAFTLAFDGHPGGLAVLFVALETGPTLTLAGVEGLGVLNPGFFLPLAAVGLDAGGGAVIPVSVPPLPGLLGATFFLQGAEASAAGVAITNPSLVAATS